MKAHSEGEFTRSVTKLRKKRKTASMFQQHGRLNVQPTQARKIIPVFWFLGFRKKIFLIVKGSRVMSLNLSYSALELKKKK